MLQKLGGGGGGGEWRWDGRRDKGAVGGRMDGRGRPGMHARLCLHSH